MYKELINITTKNIQYLKSCLNTTEAHITWGTSGVSAKYTKIKENILNKIKEQEIDRDTFIDEYNEDVENSRLLNTMFGE